MQEEVGNQWCKWENVKVKSRILRKRIIAILKWNVLTRYCVDRLCACKIGGNMRLNNECWLIILSDSFDTLILCTIQAHKSENSSILNKQKCIRRAASVYQDRMLFSGLRRFLSSVFSVVLSTRLLHSFKWIESGRRRETCVCEVEGGLTAVPDFITAGVTYWVFLYSFETKGLHCKSLSAHHCYCLYHVQNRIIWIWLMPVLWIYLKWI